jgi:hypothetical protein
LAKLISGLPPNSGDCERCATPYKGLDLMTAGLHPDLRKTEWLRGKKLGKLRVCRHCHRLWSKHRDTREDYVWYRDLGLETVHILAADTNPERIVRWTASQLPESALYWSEMVLAEFLGRRPDQLQTALNAILQTLSCSSELPSDFAAMRRNEVLTMARAVIERAASSQLRPASSAQADSAPLDPQLVRETCATHQPKATGLAYLGKNSDIVRRLAENHQRQLHAPVDEHLLSARSLSPLIAAMLPAALAGEKPGYMRGQRRGTSWDVMERIRLLARLPGNAHVIDLPDHAWEALDRALDPVSQLEISVGLILEAIDSDPTDLLHAIQEEAVLLPKLARRGARLSPHAMIQMENLLQHLRRSENHPDTVAANILQPLVNQYQHYRDRDCTADTGECALGYH